MINGGRGGGVSVAAKLGTRSPPRRPHSATRIALQIPRYETALEGQLPNLARRLSHWTRELELLHATMVKGFAFNLLGRARLFTLRDALRKQHSPHHRCLFVCRLHFIDTKTIVH